MEFNWRLLEEGDYENTLVQWWKDWRWPSPPPKGILPDEGLGGIMVMKGDVDVCAGFVCFTNSEIAWVVWVVSNFNYKNKDRKKAVNLTIDTLSLIAKDKGYNYVFTSVGNKSLQKRYEECGYNIASRDCVEMIKKI
tara:strand:- start:3535 stop:3945 length:411 start_codon:yes stop_codon:yes gene_type:complete